jgi:hypothetical protein
MIGVWIPLTIAVLGGGCGEEPAPDQEVEHAHSDTTERNSHWFLDMKPRDGDVLVPPRIGLRWQYVPSTETGMPGSTSSVSDSLLMGSPPDSQPPRLPVPPGIAFHVHVVDSLDVPYIDTETKETDIRVTLPPETPPGSYSWWIESFAEGDTNVIARSERQTFEIE